MLSATLRQLGKHSIIYGLGSLLPALLAFVLLPLYTAYLTPIEYGVFSLLLVTSNIVSVVAQMGLGSALFREIIYQESDESTALGTALTFLVATSGLFCLILTSLSAKFSSLIFSTPNYAPLLSLTFVSSLLSMTDVVAMTKLRIGQNSALFAALSMARFALGVALNIFFIAVLRRGVTGLVVAGVLQSSVSAAVSLRVLRQELRPTLSIPMLRRLLAFGVPLVPFGLARLALTSADRYFLQRFFTTHEVGLYSLGYNFGMVISLVVWAVQLAWPAQMFAIAKRPDAEGVFSKILTYYLAAIGFLGLGLSVLAREILMVMTTPAYYGAYAVVALIALSYILYGTVFITNTALETRNKVKYMSPIIIGSAVINLGLNYLLIPLYGMMGAAWATLISFSILAVVQVAVNLRLWHIPYEYKRIAKMTLVWGLIYGGCLLIRTPKIWLNFGLKLGALASYPILLYILGFYEQQELIALRQAFWSLVHSRLTKVIRS